MKRPAQKVATIFALPLVIAALSTAGLIGALTGDGWRDMLSWAGLAAPVAAVGWAWKARRS